MGDYYSGFIDPWQEGLQSDFNPYVMHTKEWELWEDGHKYAFETDYPCFKRPVCVED